MDHEPSSQNELQLGREAFERRDWRSAFEQFLAADSAGALEPEDLERLAIAAYLIGEDQESATYLARAYRAYASAGLPTHAARCAFWLGLTLLLRGESGAATAWLSRGEQQIAGVECAERGFLLLPTVELQLARGDAESAFDRATAALRLGEQFAQPDLIAIAQHLQGRALIQQWRVREGLALLDQAMLAVVSDELTPMVAGLVYCSVIEVCQSAFALERAREWTSALARWCEGQPDLMAFTGTCLVHRAEILRLSGDWPLAMSQATLACRRAKPPAQAFYQQAEIHRLRGEFDAAEAAYRHASEAGFEPLPGLALLRLDNGEATKAEAMLRRSLDTTADRARRARSLPAYVEVLLARRQASEAAHACDELEQIAHDMNTETMRAMALQSRGAVRLAAGETGEAIASLREAMQLWFDIGVPFEAARCRATIALACRELGDEEGGQLEFAAASAAFEELGASAEMAKLEKLVGGDATASKGLSQRELQVLRLVASGLTNKAIAEQLQLSQRTIDRHVSNIFDKLDVSTRSAATAFAFENGLV